MKISPTYAVPYRRKREGKTDYHKRLALLQSRKPRLVIRKTLQQLIVQVVAYSADGDRVLCSVTQKDLQKAGWKHSPKNTPAAYLLGVALGKKALTKGVREAIVDLGLQNVVKGSKLFAVVKGCLDAGLQIPCSPEVMPSEDRIAGKHIAAHQSRAKEIVTEFAHVKAALLR